MTRKLSCIIISALVCCLLIYRCILYHNTTTASQSNTPDNISCISGYYWKDGKCHAHISTIFNLYFKRLKEEIYLLTDTKFRGPSVSFCITYKDRFWQIAQTLPKNLANNRMDKDHVEFILVDFDPSDPTLKNFIFKNHAKDIASGFLKYYQTNKMPNWICPVAKNTAHYYASNEIVVNLDADNYTGYRGGLYVSHILANNKNAFLWQRNGPKDGNYGRISLYKTDFEALGGYDESLPAPVTYQDDDLIKRLEGMYRFVIYRNIRNKFIANTTEETLKHTNMQMSRDEMLQKNQEYSQKNINKRKFRANNGIYGIRQGVFRIMSPTDEVK